VQGEEFSMVLVLPNEKHGLDKLVCQMKPQHLSNMLGTRGTKQVSLALPRFKLTTQMSLVPTLKEVRKELAPQIS
jgi:serpin B